MVNIGDTVVKGQQVGIEGTTGNSTGIHTHVEMENYVANGNTWIYNARDPSKWNVIYFDPCPYMGFPNTLGISVYYDGVPVPPTPPTPIEKKSHFKFYLYKKLIDKNRKR